MTEPEPTHEPTEMDDRPATLTGCTVFDARLARVGKVTDVLFENRAPVWAIVKTGPLSGEHFVPLDDTYVDLEGRLVVPLDKTEIKRAPRVNRDHVLTTQAKALLRDYYGRAA